MIRKRACKGQEWERNIKTKVRVEKNKMEEKNKNNENVQQLRRQMV
jgi:hypothetical protein